MILLSFIMFHKTRDGDNLIKQVMVINYLGDGFVGCCGKHFIPDKTSSIAVISSSQKSVVQNNGWHSGFDSFNVSSEKVWLNTF